MRPVTYHELLCDVCDECEVNYNKVQRTEVIEEGLLCKVLGDAWSKLSDEEKATLLSEVGGGHANVGGVTNAALIALFRQGGLASYKLVLVVVNVIAKAILGRGLTWFGNMMLMRTLHMLAGPIGWAIAGVWTAFDCAGTAYRVTVPAAVYIAALRKMYCDTFHRGVSAFAVGGRDGQAWFRIIQAMINRTAFVC